MFKFIKKSLVCVVVLLLLSSPGMGDEGYDYYQDLIEDIYGLPGGCVFDWDSRMRNLAARGPNQAYGTFTNADAANRGDIGTNGLFQIPAANQPMFTLDGLALRPAAIQLLTGTMPSTFTVAAGWTHTRLSAATPISSDGAIGPTGAMEMDGIVGNTDAAAHYVLTPYYAYTSGDVITLDVFVSPGNNPGCGLVWVVSNDEADTGAVVYGAWFLLSGEGSYGGAYLGSAPDGYSISRLPGTSIYRVGIRVAITDAAKHFQKIHIHTTNSSGSGAVAGDNSTVNLWIYGAYLRKTAFFDSPILTGPDARGVVTLANTKLSLVNGAAFVDFASAAIWTGHTNKLLTIYDSAGKKITGYIKAAGTGETYGSNKITDGSMEVDPLTYWTEVRATGSLSAERTGGAGVQSYQVTSDASAQSYTQQTISLTSGALYTISVWAKRDAGTIPIIYITTGAVTRLIIGYPTASWSNITNRYCSVATEALYCYLTCWGYAGMNAWLDDFYFQQILTPSATGVTITSTAGGATYNWESIESGFNYNDSNGYSYVINEAAGTRTTESKFPQYAMNATTLAALSAGGSGFAVWVGTWGAPNSVVATGNYGLVKTNDAGTGEGLLYWVYNTGAGTGYIRSYDGANAASTGSVTPVAGTKMLCAVKWTAGGNFYVGYSTDGLTLSWGSAVGYNNSYLTTGSKIYFGHTLPIPLSFERVAIHNRAPVNDVQILRYWN